MTTISSIDARFAQTQIAGAAKGVSASVTNLTSGKRADANVADLSVGTVLATRVGTLRVTVGNAGQAKSLLETAKGALDTVLGLLQKQKNLAVKSADDSLSNNERGFLNQEFQALVSEIDRISSTANFNGKSLLDGSISGNAGTSTETGLANEQYSLLEAKDFSASGTVASGSLQDSLAVVGENLLTFGSTTNAGSVIVGIDADQLADTTAGTGGTDAVQTVSFDVAASASAATNAAAFVAAVNAAVQGATDSTYDNFAQFDFLDNGDGTVTVRAKEAGADLNGYGFYAEDNATVTAVALGATGSTVSILDNTSDGTLDQDSLVVSTFSSNAVTTGADGIFKAVAANNIADTKFSGVLNFGDSNAVTGSVNGIKRVAVGAITAGANTDTFTFGTQTFTVKTAGTTTAANDIDVGIFADATAQAQFMADRLNALSQDGTGGAVVNAYTYDAAAGTITATAKNFGAPDTAVFAAGGESSGAVNTAGSIAGEAGTAETYTITIRDGSNTSLGDITWTIAANTGTAAYTDDQLADFFLTEMQQAGDTTNAKRLFDYTNNNDGTVTLTAKTAGTEINSYDIEFDGDQLGIGGGATNFSLTLGGTTLIEGTAMNFGATGSTLGTNKSVAPSDLTFDANLLGNLTNLKGTFSLGAGNDGSTDDSNNTVQFTVDVNGETYTSNVIQLLGNTASSTISNTIRAGTDIVFQRSSGPVDSNGANTNNAFALNVETDINLATVTSSATGQASLQTAVDNLQTQLDSISINQDRSFNLTEINASGSDHRITAAVGTILEGLVGFDAVGTNRLVHNDGDIKLISDQYGDSGTHGDITSFNVDRFSDTISTTINGETYTAYLNSGNAPTTGNIKAFGTDLDGGSNDGSYSATTKVISLAATSTGETPKLNFFSSSTTDGKVLQIDLGNVAANVSQININSAEGESALQSALNAVFDVSSNDSLSFQVGAEATDTIGVSIGGAKTTNIYLDDDGVAQTLSVATIDDAIEASNVIDNAINTVVSLVSDVSAKISAFDSSIQNNNASIQNADAARSNLLDTDYSQESTKFAESRVRVDAATAVLTQVNVRIQNLLQLLQQ